MRCIVNPEDERTYRKLIKCEVDDAKSYNVDVQRSIDDTNRDGENSHADIALVAVLTHTRIFRDI